MVNQDLAFARLMSNISTELFQRREPNSNKLVKKSAFSDETINVDEKIVTSEIDGDVLYKWGPDGGFSPFVNASPLQGQWGIGVWG